MKITLYELLGLIKGGKAPKKIKYDIRTFELSNYGITKGIYVDEDGDALFDDYNWDLNDEVIILDKEKKDNFSGIKYFSDGECVMSIANETPIPVEDEFIDIEEFSISYSLDYIDYKNIDVLKNHLNKDFQIIFDTFDVLIKNQKKIINKLKEEGK